MKKIIKTAVVSAVMSAAIFCGCGKEVAGEDLINAARDSYRALDSAYVEVVNDDTKEAEQTFTFKYDEKDILTYYYYGTDGENTIARFYNGYEEYTEQNGTVTLTEKGDPQFPGYDRDLPYPMADKGLIVFQKKSVAESDIETIDDGSSVVSHVYDVSDMQAVEGEGDITSFTVVYYFNSDKTLDHLTQITVFDLNGDKTTRCYSVYISRENSVESVENGIDISKAQKAE